MQRKGYSSIEDFRGQLQPYVQHKPKPGLTKKSAAALQDKGGGTGGRLILGIATCDTLMMVALMALGFFVVISLDLVPRFVPPPRNPEL